MQNLQLRVDLTPYGRIYYVNDLRTFKGYHKVVRLPHKVMTLQGNKLELLDIKCARTEYAKNKDSGVVNDALW